MDKQTRSLPVLAVGISAGGGYMAHAVTDDTRLRAFAGVAGYYSDAAAFAESSPVPAYQAAINQGRAAAALASDGGGQDHPTVPEMAETWRCAICARRTSSMGPGIWRGGQLHERLRRPSFAYTSHSTAQEAAARIRVPFLLVHSDSPAPAPWRGSFCATIGGPKSELWLQSQGQIDFYDKPRLIGPAVGLVHEHTCVNTRTLASSTHGSARSARTWSAYTEPLRSAWPADERASPALSM